MNLSKSFLVATVLALITSSSLAQIIHQSLTMVPKATAEQDFINSFKMESANTNAHDAIYRLAMSTDRYKVALFTDVYLGTDLQKENFMLDTGIKPFFSLTNRVRSDVDVQKGVHRRP